MTFVGYSTSSMVYESPTPLHGTTTSAFQRDRCIPPLVRPCAVLFPPGVGFWIFLAVVSEDPCDNNLVAMYLPTVFPTIAATALRYLQKLAGMEFEVTRRGFRSNAERGVMQHNAWTGLMKLLRQTAENTSGISIKHPKLVGLDFSAGKAGRSTKAVAVFRTMPPEAVRRENGGTSACSRSEGRYSKEECVLLYHTAADRRLSPRRLSLLMFLLTAAGSIFPMSARDYVDAAGRPAGGRAGRSVLPPLVVVSPLCASGHK